MKQFLHALALILCGLGSLCVTPAQAQAWRWLQQAEPTVNPPHTPVREVILSAMTMTAHGEVYAAYSSRDTLLIGGYALPGTGQSYSHNCAVVRFDSTGRVLGTVLTGTQTEVRALQFDSAGNLYAAGYFKGQLRLLNGVLLTSHATATVDPMSFFVLKLNPAGGLEWFQEGDTQSVPLYQFSAGVTSLAVDGYGRVTVASEPRANSIQFSGQPAISTRGFVVQFDATGALRWQKSSLLAPKGLAVTRGGTLYLALPQGQHFSSVIGPVTFGTDTLSTDPEANIWLALNADGRVQAVRSFGNKLIMSACVATDPEGNCYFVAETGSRPGFYSTIFPWGRQPLALSRAANMQLVFVKVTPNGALQWYQVLHMRNRTGFSSGFMYPVSLSVVADGSPTGVPRLYAGAMISSSLPDTLVCGAVIRPILPGPVGMIIELDGLTGEGGWLEPAGTDYLGQVAADRAGRVALRSRFTGDSIYYGSFLVAKKVPGLRGTVGVTAMLEPDFAQLSGDLFMDTNRDGIRGAGEVGFGDVIVEAQGGPGGSRYFSAAASSGTYGGAVPLGTYALSVPNPPRYYAAVATGPTTATLTGFGTVSGGHRFALQPTVDRQDLQLTLTHEWAARPGFPTRYCLTVRNVGTVVIPNPVLQLHFARPLTFDSASLAPTAVDTTLTWNLGALAPRAVKTIVVDFTLAPSTPLETLLTVGAQVEPLTGDLTPTDNTETVTTTVTGSFDPNDIRVSPATLTESQVQAANQLLDYTVRFQNTGTDTAFTVVIRDTLPAHLLQLSTLQVIATSHTASWRLLPEGVLMVTFPNIQLPDSTTNEPASHGFVRFRVLPRTTLTAGDVIQGQADIYFDFNTAVMTNTVLTTVLRPTGRPGSSATLPANAWPNPASHTLHVAASMASSNEPLTLTLADALGRPVRAIIIPGGKRSREHVFELTGLAPGLYIVRATTADRHWSQRVLIR